MRLQDALNRTGLEDIIGKDNVYESIGIGVEAFQQRQKTKEL